MFKKNGEFFNDIITNTGNLAFNKELILDIDKKYIHSKRDNLRSKLKKKDFRNPCPTRDRKKINQVQVVKYSIT